MENCRLVLAVYCEFFLLSCINALPMSSPPPSARFQHLTAGQWGRGRAWTFATGQPGCCTGMRPSPDWKLDSPELPLLQAKSGSVQHFVALTHDFLRRSPHQFPFLPFFYMPLSPAYCAVFIVILPNVTRSYTATGISWHIDVEENLLCPKLSTSHTLLLCTQVFGSVVGL